MKNNISMILLGATDTTTLATTTTTTTISASSSSSQTNSFHLKILIASLIFIIIVGTIGNILNIIVFSKRSMRQGSTFRFLLYLAITDLLVLLVCSTDALIKFGFQWEFRVQSTLSCRVHTFLTYFLAHSSSIILMIISVDRALVVTNHTACSLFSKLCCFCCPSNPTNTSNAPTAATNNAAVNNMSIRASVTKNSNSNGLAGGGGGESHMRQSVVYNRKSSDPTGTMAIFRKESSLNQNMDYNPSKSKFKLSFLNNFHHVDIVIFLTVAFLGLLNSHYLVFLNLNIMPGQDNSNTSVVEEVMSSTTTTTTTPPTTTTPSATNNSSTSSNEVIKVCFPVEGAYETFLINYWLYIDIIIYSFLPVIVMSICSILILGAVRKTNKSYVGKLVTNLNSDARRLNIYKRSKKERQILYMLLITILYFFLSQLPYCIAFILYRGQESESYVMQYLVHILSYSNNAINFLFYGLSSQKYRQELLSIFVGKCCLNSRNLNNQRHQSIVQTRCDVSTQVDHHHKNVSYKRLPVKTQATTTSTTTSNGSGAVVFVENHRPPPPAVFDTINNGILKRDVALADIESLNSREDVPLDASIEE